MFNLTLNIGTPFKIGKFRHLWARGGLITTHKAWEAESYLDPEVLLLMSCAFSTRRDHAGLLLELGLFSFMLNFQIYDTRHWDDETDDWVKYDDKN